MSAKKGLTALQAQPSSSARSLRSKRECKLAEYLTGTKVPDLNSGFRAFRRDVASQFLHLLPKGFSRGTSITMAFLAHGYYIRYIDIPYAARSGRSHVHWWSDTRRYMLQVVRMFATWNPLRLFMPMAMVFFVLGDVELPYDIVTYDWRIAANTLLALLAAGLTAMIGILADLIGQLNKAQDTVPPVAWEVEDSAA